MRAACTTGRYCSRCDLLVGLDGLHGVAVARDQTSGGLSVAVESPPGPQGCPSCGVVAHSHGRRDVRLVLQLSVAPDDLARARTAILTRLPTAPEVWLLRLAEVFLRLSPTPEDLAQARTSLIIRLTTSKWQLSLAEILLRLSPTPGDLTHARASILASLTVHLRGARHTTTPDTAGMRAQVQTLRLLSSGEEWLDYIEGRSQEVLTSPLSPSRILDRRNARSDGTDRWSSPPGSGL